MILWIKLQYITVIRWLRKFGKAQQTLAKSAFDRFVLNNGYKFPTKGELQAGYDWHWKARRDILVPMEKFLAEVGKRLSDSSADTYETLVGLVDKKKLHEGDVLGYAHYHRCLSRPEAVIAHQMGSKEWAVNNCDTQITVEQAQVEVCKEWGFEASRIHIIGTPYYDAADYQFIRFECTYMTWLWQNRSLYQVYC